MRYPFLLFLLILVACDGSFRQRTAKYALVCDLEDNRAAVYDANTQGWGYVDSTGMLVIPCRFESAATFSEGVAVVRTEQQYGYIDTQGQFVIQPRYSVAENFAGGYARVQQKSLWGIINHTGRQVIPCSYTSLGDPLPNGWIPVTIDTQHGYVTREGYPIIPCIYDQVEEPDHYGLVRVMQLTKHGLLDTSGTELQPCGFTYISRFREGRARINIGGAATSGTVPEGGAWGIIDSTGCTMLSCRHFWIDEYSEGRALYQSAPESLLGYLDAWGHVAIEPRYRMARPFQEGAAPVSINAIDFGLIDRNGKPLCDFRYKFIGTFCEGLALVNTDPFGANFPGMKHRCGYIDTRGKEAIPLDYDDATSFSEGFAAVLRYGVVADFHDARWGYIDLQGHPITPFLYHKAEPFHKGLARVFIQDKGFGFIDTLGHPVVECLYDEAGTYDNGTIWVRSGEIRLLFDAQGNPIAQ